MRTAIIGNCKNISSEELYRMLKAFAPDTDTIITGNGSYLSHRADEMATAHGLGHMKIVADHASFGKCASRYKNFRLVRESDFILSVGEGYCVATHFILTHARRVGKPYKAIRNFFRETWESILKPS